MPERRDAPLLLEVADRDELRAWLVANHATSTGVLLAIGTRGSAASALR